LPATHRHRRVWPGDSAWAGAITGIATEYTAELTKPQPANAAPTSPASAPWQKSPAPLGSQNPPPLKASLLGGTSLTT
jgi:hypothetical protein